MNNSEKVIAALGETGGGPEAGKEDLQAKLEKSMHTADVWSGRAKKLAEEKAALEEELRRIKSKDAVRNATERLTPEELGDTPKDFVETSGRVAAALVEEAEGRQTEELRKLREELAERDRNSFRDAIGAANRKFFEDVGPGGDKSAMWEQFKSNNRETLAAVMKTHDVARFNRMVEAFYREIGVPNPSGVQGGSVAPDPRSTVGGQNGVGGGANADGQTFTQEQYLKALEKAEDDFRASGDVKAYRAATDALNRALNEGRVK